MAFVGLRIYLIRFTFVIVVCMFGCMIACINALW